MLRKSFSCERYTFPAPGRMWRRCDFGGGAGVDWKESRLSAGEMVERGRADLRRKILRLLGAMVDL